MFLSWRFSAVFPLANTITFIPIVDLPCQVKSEICSYALSSTKICTFGGIRNSEITKQWIWLCFCELEEWNGRCCYTSLGGAVGSHFFCHWFLNFRIEIIFFWEWLIDLLSEREHFLCRCPVCLHKWTEPALRPTHSCVVFPCGHLMCCICVERMIELSRWEVCIECPICRAHMNAIQINEYPILRPNGMLWHARGIRIWSFLNHLLPISTIDSAKWTHDRHCIFGGWRIRKLVLSIFPLLVKIVIFLIFNIKSWCRARSFFLFYVQESNVVLIKTNNSLIFF